MIGSIIVDSPLTEQLKPSFLKSVTRFSQAKNLKDFTCKEMWVLERL